jgi:hypothetical protein
VYRRRNGDRDDHRARLIEQAAGAVPVLAVEAIAGGELLDVALDPAGRPTRPLVFVDLDGAESIPRSLISAAANRLRNALPVSVGIARANPGSIPPELLDSLSLTVTAAETDDRRVVSTVDVGGALDALMSAAVGAPRAVIALGRVLRQTAVLSVLDGLAAESAVYSMLLAGPEFSSWLHQRGAARPAVPGSVEVARVGDVVGITVNRPSRRNAIDSATRDALVDALALLGDPEIRIELRGHGPSFGAGGDLDEFGSAPDPASAHVVRLEQSVGRAIDPYRDRVTAFVHGACYGAGCELPAFAGRVVAASDTRLALPEISLGLIPGAGGTVSVTRRVGRWRTAWMALSGAEVDADTALRWGLVDSVAG